MLNILTRLKWDIERAWGWARGNREVALIIRDARSSGFVRSKAEFFPYLRKRGVTIEDYKRYERTRTIRHVVICASLSLAVIVIEIYLAWRAAD